MESKDDDDEKIELQQEVIYLETVISQGRQLVDKLNSDINTYREQLGEATSVQAQLQEDNAQIQQRLDAANAEACSAQLKIADFEKQCEELNAKLAEANSQCKDTELQLRGAEGKVSEHERELDHLNKWGDDLEELLTMTKETLEEAKQKKRELNAEITELKRQNQKTAADLEHERVTARAEFQHEVQRLKEQLEAAQEELESEIEQQKRQTQTISDLESQLRNEKLRSQALEDKFWRANDKLEDGEERWQKERAYLEETKRDLQQRIRRLQQPDADDTIACFQHQKPAPAARPPGSGGLPPEKKINFALKLGNSEQVLVLLSYITA